MYNNKFAEKKIMKTILFTIIINHLETKLNKEVKKVNRTTKTTKY
jgi:hypothetical protein